MKLVILFIMIFLHIVDDYYLQGILASMKQKEWWRNLPNYDNMYRNDYKVALIMHSFSWSFMVHIPVLLHNYNLGSNLNLIMCCISILMHTTVHALVDNAKANRLTINLIVDQTTHLCQILLIWLLAFT